MRSLIYKYIRNLCSQIASLNRQGTDPCFGFVATQPRNARGFLKERKAAVAVELAIIGAPFLLMILEIFQSALFVYYSGMLNHATESAARQILVGSVQNKSLTQTQFINNLLCPLLPAAMSCGNVIVNLQTVSEAGYPGGFYAFVNSSQTAIIIPPLNNTQTSFCPGGSGDYVYLQVFYAMPLIIPVWLPTVTTSFQGQTVKLVSAAAAFKNEPYQSSYSGC